MPIVAETLRQVENRQAARKQAAIEHSLQRYGDAARLDPLPPGPDTCPDHCPHCPPRVAEPQGVTAA